MVSLIQCVVFPPAGSAGGAESDRVTSGFVDKADSGGVGWYSGVCSSSSGGTWPTRP